MAKTKEMYEEAHLFVAAVRVLTHKQTSIPTIEEICSLLSYSVEWGHSMSRQLQKLQIIDITESPFSIKVTVKDHTQLETISKTSEKSSFEQDLENFKKKKKDISKKVEAIQADLKRKQKDLFADLEAKMKKEAKNINKQG